VITAVNSGLEDAPEKINTDPYEEGWLFKIELKSALAFQELMGPEEYVEYVESQG
jgi:glycine cleavage system H protein